MPADRLALAVELRDAPPEVGAKVDGADVLHIDRGAVDDLERDRFQIGEALMYPRPRT